MRKTLVIPFCALSALALAAAVPASAAKAPAPKSAASAPEKQKHLRLYAPSSVGERRYYTGYDWRQFNLNQKIQLVETARTGALKLNVVMTLPAELYVRELDRMFASNPQVQHMEIGQAIEGTAVVLKDWDDGTDPDKKLQELTKAASDSVRR